MGVFYSMDLEHLRLSELEFVVEREYLGESLGRFLLRGQSPQEFARHLFGDAHSHPNSVLMQDFELRITDADSLAAAIHQLIDWKALFFAAAWPDAEGQLLDGEGRLVRSISFSGLHADEQVWRERVEEALIDAGFVRAAPWGDSGTRVVPI